MRIIGITGAFGCGKSTVLKFFQRSGWHVYDADADCHQLYSRRDPALFALLHSRFPAEIFRENGDADLAAIAGLVFGNPVLMGALTGVIYPLLRQHLQTEIAECRRLGYNGAFELPLLYEKDFAGFFPETLAIWCDHALRRERLHGRHFTDAEIARRDAEQLPMSEKMSRADYAVINNGSIALLEQQLQLFCEGC